jgi:diguanylate cyclase (GGDEF)-like protein/PAS domain S-box-containing protein
VNSDLSNKNIKKTLLDKSEASVSSSLHETTTDGTAEAIVSEPQAHQLKLEVQAKQLQQAQSALQLSQNHYEDLYEFSPTSYLTITTEEIITECNLKTSKVLGLGRNILINKRLSQFVANQDKDRWQSQFANLKKAESEIGHEFDLTLVGEDGVEICTHLQCMWRNENNSARMLRIVLTDVTARKFIENSKREQEEFFRFIAENSEDFIAVLDLDGKRLYNNLSYAKLFGDIENLEGTDSFADIHPDDRERIRKIFNETIQSGVGQRSEFRFLLPNGNIRYIESSGGLVKNSEGEPSFIVVVSHDITERKRIEEEVQHLAYFDHLTQLPNRRLFNDRIIQAIAASRRNGRFGAVIFLDLDNFKPINDEYGHSVGDLLLIEVANRLKICVREVDTVSRFGGDEFVVMVNELHSDKAKSTIQAEIVAEKVRLTLSEPYRLIIKQDEKPEITIEHHCTASIGVTIFGDYKASQDDILKTADSAMYEAKLAGGNLIRFYDPKV